KVSFWLVLYAAKYDHASYNQATLTFKDF
ncbi:uncharacterized protein METZ01_LOCUS95379, partial [marine metagenome]